MIAFVCITPAKEPTYVPPLISKFSNVKSLTVPEVIVVNKPLLLPVEEIVKFLTEKPFPSKLPLKANGV